MCPGVELSQEHLLLTSAMRTYDRLAARAVGKCMVLAASVALTAPVWLFQRAPKRSDHRLS